MSNIKALITTALAVLFLGACGSKDSSPAPVTKEQLKGAWQMTGVGDKQGHTGVIDNSRTPSVIQIEITDSEFTTLMSDDRGLIFQSTRPYTYDGKNLHIIEENSKGTTYEVIAASANKLMVKDTAATGDTAPILIYTKIAHEKLASKASGVHPTQTISATYSLALPKQKPLSGQMEVEAPFRSSEGGKYIQCSFSKGQQENTGTLAVTYMETSAHGSVSTDKNSMLRFVVPLTSFQMSKPSEIIHAEAKGSDTTSLISINDVPRKAHFYQLPSTTCSVDIVRTNKNLKIEENCQGLSSHGAEDPNGSLKIDASCELETWF